MESHNSKNDPKKLIELAKDGDNEAFSRLYELCFVPIFRYIYFRIKNKEDTQDLIQDVFLKVYQNLPNYQDKNKSPLAYFYTIARNAVIDYWRKRKIIVSENSGEVLTRIADTASSPPELIEKKEVSQIIRQVIQSLTEEQQEVIILKFINELPNKEITQLLKKSEEAIRQLQCRAIKTLRQKFKDLKIL